MIKYRKGCDIDYIRLIEMFTEAGSDIQTDDFKKLVTIVEGSSLVITAWDYDYMIGFARVDSDGRNARINDMVVDIEYADKDIDKHIINNILTVYPDCKLN